MASVVGFIALIWGLFGVPFQDSALFLGYVAAFAIVPGCAAFIALTRPGRLGIREVALGWGLGYALEVGFFALTAATGTRGLFVWYPAVVVLATAPWTLPRLRGPREGRRPTRRTWIWGLALVCCVAVSYLAESFYTQAPLPWDAPAASYYQDVVWNIAMSAEALHHWPLQIPSLAGLPLRYHYFADIDAAAASQVTGQSLAAILLRFAMVPMTVLVMLQFVTLGRALGSGAWTGVIAGALFTLAGFADPVPTPPSRLLATFPLSPSFLYGLVVFLPLLTLLCERIANSDWPPRHWRGYLVTATLLMAACAGGKATILPVLVGTIVITLLVAWRWPFPRMSARVLLAAGAAAVAVLIAFQLTMYAGGQNSFRLKPFAIFGQAQPFDLLLDELGRSAPVVAAVGLIAVPVGTLKLLAVLIPGLAALVLSRRLDGPRVLMLAAMVAGLLPLYLFSHPGQSQFYFFFYGFAAATAASAVGLAEFALPALRRASVRPPVVAAGVVLVVVAWLATTPVVGTRAVYSALDGAITYSQQNSNLTPALYAGLRWVEGNTSPSAIIAVSNRFQDTAKADARYCYFTAFAERRAMAECSYDGTSRPYGALRGNTERLALNNAIFGSADRGALEQAVRRYGVDYLLVDRIHGGTAPDVTALGRTVYQNEALVVIDVRANRATAQRRLRTSQSDVEAAVPPAGPPTTSRASAPATVPIGPARAAS